jgi:hypothetical protein
MKVRIVPLKTVQDLGSYPDWLGNPRAIRIGGGAIVEVLTDQGITGIGPEIAASLLPSVKALLVGADPFAPGRKSVTSAAMRSTTSETSCPGMLGIRGLPSAVL